MAHKADPRPLHPGRVKKTDPRVRRAAEKLAADVDAIGSPSRANQAGQLLAGIALVATALAAWALTFVLGGRPVINDLLHGELGGSTGLEIAIAGLFAFGGVFILGLGWSIGTAYRSK